VRLPLAPWSSGPRILPRIGGALSNGCVWRKNAHTLALLSFLFLLLLLLAVPLPAQEENPTTGTIHGTIKDEDGNAVAGARVLFRSKATFTSGVARSDKDGTYSSEALPPGPYTVRVEARNLHVASASVRVLVGEAATADFRLQPINPGPPRVESHVAAETVDTLPINGKATLDTARLEPGVQVVDGTVLDAGKTGYQTLSINNGFGRTTHYDIDEVEAMDETRGTVVANVPAEAVQEVVVTRSVPEVFQSLNAAGSVRVTTRSGGDEWHGNLFGNLRDRRAGVSGFPPNDPKYNRQQYGFGAGGALIKDKAFLFVGGERSKQDGELPVYQGFPFNFESSRDATFRENMLSARVDYNLSENAKGFARFGYDNADQFGPTDSLAKYRDQINVPSAVFGLDWNPGRFAHSGRFGYQKLVNAINPAFGKDVLVFGAPFHQQIGSFETGPSDLGPRQTIQRDLFGRYDGRTVYQSKFDLNHTLRFGGAIHRIAQGDFYTPGNFGPSITSSNGFDVIQAIDANPTFPAIIPGDPRGPADNPFNYPVGTFTIFNGLGNFSEHSAFNGPNGGHFDTRLEAYVADTFKLFSNLNITVGVNYVRDSGRTNSDLGSIPCSAINTTIVKNPPCAGSSPILDQFGGLPGLGARVHQPNLNFAPQVGVAWDPKRNGKTVVRAGGGMFYDNFLLQNAYQDRMSRLASGQYFRSLTLCPATTVLFPDGSQVSAINTVSAGEVTISQICGQAIGAMVTGTQGSEQVWQAIGDLQKQYQAAQSAVTGGPNVYSLANSLANFGGMLAPNFKTPRVVHINIGIQHQFGERSVFSIDYVRQIGTQFPLGIDTNHVGDVTHLDSNAALAAINATVTAVGCPAAGSPGAESQAAVDCYLAAVPGPNHIVDFARNGLDSANAYCGPFPCSVVKPAPTGNAPPNAAAFSGINPAVGSNLMFFPSGRSKYEGVQLAFKTTMGENPLRGVRRMDLGVSYTFSKYRSNVAMADGSGGDFSLLSVAEDYRRPHVGHFGPSGLDRRNQFTFTPSLDLLHGVRLAMLAQMASPLEQSARLPQLNGGGVAGEIFRSDVTGDGTVGDLLPGTGVGGLGGYSGNNLGKAIAYFNNYYAARLTPAGGALSGPNQVGGQTIPPLMTIDQLSKLGALTPFLQPLPAHPAGATWLKTIDLRLSRPIHAGERVIVEPNFAAFNVFNFANFGGPGRQLSGVLNASPGSSLNYSSSAGFCGGTPGLCTSRLDRITAGSGTYGYGAPRQLEFGVKIVF